MYPEELRYTPEHEWVRIEGQHARVGITFYAQKELGDVVFVDLPKVGDEVGAGEAFAVVESVKAVSDIYAPVSGTVTEVNAAVGERPELINEDPYGRGWIALIKMNAPAQIDDLLSAEGYRQQIGEA